MKVEKPVPPKGLSREAAAWWSKIIDEYGVADSGGLLLLEVVAKSYDRLLGAEAMLAREGAVVKDRFGQSRPHPALVVEKTARAGLVQALRAMNLDIAPPGKIGRPGR